MEQADVIIIGAGICGLTAARALSKRGKKIILVEARNRSGGRIHTIVTHGFSRYVEEGAEFIHGDLPLTMKTLAEGGIEKQIVSGDMWQKRDSTFCKQEDFVDHGELIAEKVKELDEDMSVKDFLDKYFGGEQYATLRNDTIRYIEGYDAADITKASAQAMAEDVASDEDQYHVKGGYEKLVSYLEEECVKNGCLFFFEQAVKEIHWSAGVVEVHTANGMSYGATSAVVTVPLGILQADGAAAGIRFLPELPGKMKAAKAIGYGNVIKFMLEFKEAFWANASPEHDLSDMGFVFSGERVPTWWTQKPEQDKLLTGWMAGPAAEKLGGATQEQLLDIGIASLAAIFDSSSASIRAMLKAWHIKNWQNDPYSLGAYSYATLGGKEAKKELAEPVDNTIYFAGEGVYDGEYIATVEAALTDGVRVAKMID